MCEKRRSVCEFGLTVTSCKAAGGLKLKSTACKRGKLCNKIWRTPIRPEASEWQLQTNIAPFTWRRRSILIRRAERNPQPLESSSEEAAMLMHLLYLLYMVAPSVLPYC